MQPVRVARCGRFIAVVSRKALQTRSSPTHTTTAWTIVTHPVDAVALYRHRQKHAPVQVNNNKRELFPPLLCEGPPLCFHEATLSAPVLLPAYIYHVQSRRYLHHSFLHAWMDPRRCGRRRPWRLPDSRRSRCHRYRRNTAHGSWIKARLRKRACAEMCLFLTFPLS